ncbi:helix-turn-helix transcriptional regulator [Brevundimonas sp. DC300-4]|uniref:helix-turn-helix transcriptional regulator n=1 Tax=Brevundimonas sp. DC300-4 TaxID=2804594 RepID=UPI003CED1F10
MSQKVYRLKELMDVVGLRRSAIADRLAAGDFPNPIQLGPRAKGWLVDEVDKWLAERMVARDGKAAAVKAAAASKAATDQAAA